MAENKGALVPKSTAEVQARPTTSPLPSQINNLEAKFRPPVSFTASIRSALSFLALSVSRLIGPNSGGSCGRRSERRGNGRGRGQGKGRCLRN